MNSRAPHLTCCAAGCSRHLRLRKRRSPFECLGESPQWSIPGDDVLREFLEVLAAKRTIVTHDDMAGELHVKRKSRACDSIYPGGVQWANVSADSRSADLRRGRKVDSLKRIVHAGLLREARSTK